MAGMMLPAISGSESAKGSQSCKKRCGKAYTDDMRLFDQGVGSVAEDTPQDGEHKAEPQPGPATQGDEKDETEDEIAEQVPGIGVQRERGRAAPPLVQSAGLVCVRS